MEEPVDGGGGTCGGLVPGRRGLTEEDSDLGVFYDEAVEKSKSIAGVGYVEIVLIGEAGQVRLNDWADPVTTRRQ